MEIAVDADARILGVRGQLIHETGAYVPWGIVLPWITATTVPGPYVIPHFKLDVVSVFTNKIQTTPVRGAGRPEAVMTMERLMDRVARELKLDPAEVRRRNFIQPEQMPYNVGIIFRDGRPVTYDSGDYPACQAGALELRTTRASRSGRRRRANPAVIWASGWRTRSRRRGWDRTRAPRCAFRPPARSSSIPAPRRRDSRTRRRWRRSRPINSASISMT